MPKKTETRPPTAHISPFGLRMQPELRQLLETSASEAGRSLNAEIVARLEASFDEAKVSRKPSDDLNHEGIRETLRKIEQNQRQVAIINEELSRLHREKSPSSDTTALIHSLHYHKELIEREQRDLRTSLAILSVR